MKNGWIPVSRTFLKTYASKGITPTEAMVILHMLAREWVDGKIIPSSTQLAEEMGIHARTVKRAIKGLKDKGVLTAVNRPGLAPEYDFGELFTWLSEVGKAGGDKMGTPPQSVTPLPTEDKIGTTPNSGGDPPTKSGRVPSENQGSPSVNGPPKKEDNRILLGPSEASPLGRVVEQGRKRSAGARKHRKREAAESNPPPDQSEERTRVFVPGEGEKHVEDFNCNDMLKVWRRLYSKRWRRVSPPAPTNRDRKQMKTMIDDHGAPAILACIEFTLSNWTKLKAQYDWNGYPSVALLFAFRHSLVPQATAGEDNEIVTPAERGTAQWKGGPSRDEGEQGGWGDL